MLPPLIFDLFLIKFLTESRTSFLNVPKTTRKETEKTENKKIKENRKDREGK
jgi:hypothetical protein